MNKKFESLSKLLESEDFMKPYDFSQGEKESTKIGSIKNKMAKSFDSTRELEGNELTSKHVINHLKAIDDEHAKAAEYADAIAFGLETTNGQVFKVYVKKEDADEFETAMSELLGDVDDIDEAIETLSEKFDILQVLRPGEEGGIVSPDEEGDESTDEQIEDTDAEPDGSSIETALDEPLSDDDHIPDLEDDDHIPDLEDEDENRDEDDKKKKSTKKKEDDKDEKPDDKPEGENDENGEDDDDLNFDEDDTKKEDNESDDKEEDGVDDVEENDDDEEEKEKKKKPIKAEKLKEDVSGAFLKPKFSDYHISDASDIKKDYENSEDFFYYPLTKDEEIFAETEIQGEDAIAAFKLLLCLGVEFDQILIRRAQVVHNIIAKTSSIKRKNRLAIKTVNLLGGSLVGHLVKSSKKQIKEGLYVDPDISDTLDSSVIRPDAGFGIKSSLHSEIERMIFDCITALGVSEFALEFHRLTFLRNVERVARELRHNNIAARYMHELCDILNVHFALGDLKDYAKDVKDVKHEYEPVEQTLSIREMFAKTTAKKSIFEEMVEIHDTEEASDLGTGTIIDLGSSGGIEVKIKTFVLEFSVKQFLDFALTVEDGGGACKSDNLGNISVIPHGREFVVKTTKPSERFPNGVILNRKTVSMIKEKYQELN